MKVGDLRVEAVTTYGFGSRYCNSMEFQGFDCHKAYSSFWHCNRLKLEPLI